MKKAYIILIIVISILIIGVIALVLLSNKGQTAELSFEDIKVEDDDSRQHIVEVSIKAKDETQAKKMADVFGVEFIEYYSGYGYYKTNKSATELYEIAEKNGYPIPQISREMQLFE